MITTTMLTELFIFQIRILPYLLPPLHPLSQSISNIGDEGHHKHHPNEEVPLSVGEDSNLLRLKGALQLTTFELILSCPLPA